jgi:hypothetical protein
MLLRKEDVEMWAENASGLLSRSPLRFDRMPDRSQRSFWEGPSSSHSSSYGAAPPLAGTGANNGQRAPALRGSARWRRDLLIEDMKDLLGRAVIYALTLLGLLHVLGLVAPA